MSFADQKPRIVTEKEVALPWNGNKRNFRCYLCGHRFQVGDTWRFVFGGGRTGNLLVCDTCDGPDVIERYLAMAKEHKERFWHFAENPALRANTTR